MTIGLSTYAYFWQHSDRVDHPLSLTDMVDLTAEQGVEVFQICDYPAIADLDADRLRRLLAHARSAGVTLELGTRGVMPDHLARWLQLAQTLEATTVRSMLYTTDHRPTAKAAKELLEQVLPAYEAVGVRIALETYEQVHSKTLADLVAEIDSPSLGICSDPANCVAALELPTDVLDRVAPYVVNMHIKDFAFTRQDGWVGFNLVGAPLGTGLLDYDDMIVRVNPDPTVNQIIEHWLPWQGTAEATISMEQQWTTHNISYLRSKQS